LEDFHSGRIAVGDIEIDPATPARLRRGRLCQIRRRVGMVFQQFNLFPHRSVLDNVTEAPIHVLKKPRGEAVAEARALLDRVGLSAKLDAMPATLSGGQQQRVAIARALAMHPDMILFDEPTSALDPRMSAEVESAIADLAGTGQTMVVVTHAMGFARRTAHTMYVFQDGRILESGPPEQIFDAPRHEETRRFVAEADGG
jgi:ABC-type polar amino acid transport system ATPase subunit